MTDHKSEVTTISEVAAVYGRTRAAIHLRVKSGDIPSRESGGVKLLNWADVEAVYGPRDAERCSQCNKWFGPDATTRLGEGNYCPECEDAILWDILTDDQPVELEGEGNA